MEHESNETEYYGERMMMVHRLLNPYHTFPRNLVKKKIPRSQFIEITEKKSFSSQVLFLLFLLIPSILFPICLYFDVYNSYGVKSVNVERNCQLVNCSIPNVIEYGEDLFAIPIQNVTV